MLKLYTYSQIALIIRHWFEVDPTDGTMEHGVRLELRSVSDQPWRGTESASQRFVIDTPHWRADLFDRLGSTPGSFSAGHYHPKFIGDEPCDRVWDKALQADPWKWLTAQIERMPQLLADAGKLSDSLAESMNEVCRDTAAIVQDAQSFQAITCTNSRDCFDLTRDVAHVTAGVIRGISGPSKVDQDYVRPWLTNIG